MKDKPSPNWNELVRLLLECYTQEDLSAITGVHQGTISDLNRGVNKPRLSYKSGAALIEAKEALGNKLEEF